MIAPRYITTALALAIVTLAHATDPRTETDPAGDTLIRRTDPGNDGAIRPDTRLPDLLAVRLDGWSPTNPASDLFDGQSLEQAHFLRIDVSFDGLINPPAPVGINGLPYEPFRYGPSPALGFIEIDIDNDRDTGGALADNAITSYLANVARFGVTPGGSVGARAILREPDRDSDFFTPPQFERSGADFLIALCGCHDVTLVSKTGDADDLFEPGETFIVASRFFKRAAGYQDACAAAGGSAPGLYDPVINARFSHDIETDITTASIVFPLDPTGAAQMTGEPVQPIDLLIGIAGSHFSLEEAIQDIIDGADGLNGPLSDPVEMLTVEWRNEDADEHLSPREWRIAAIVGTAYEQQESAPYVWTDVANSRSHDPITPAAIAAEITSLDGGSDDADGTVNGTVQLTAFPARFSLFDIDYDGTIGPDDVGVIDPCPADRDGDNDADIIDLLLYLGNWFVGNADIDASGDTDILDLLLYLEQYLPGC